MRRTAALVLSFCISVILISPLAQAHESEVFTINIRSDGIEPTSSEAIVLEDAALWINFDSTNNTTHRIVYDSNGDGLYNGSGEWDSGQLLAWTAEGTCLEDDGNRTEDCEVSFRHNFSNVSQLGSYVYQDLTYVDGVLTNATNATLLVSLDSHGDDHPCLGSDCDDAGSGEVEAEAGTDSIQWLLVIALIAGLGALGLGLKMLFSSPRQPQDRWFDQEE